MKTWSQIYFHALDMKRIAPTSIVACQLFNTVVATAPETPKLVEALHQVTAQFEIEKQRYASDPGFVTECEQKIAGNKELLAWIEEG